MPDTFEAQVAVWLVRAEAEVERVVKTAALDVVEEMQRPVQEGGNLPVDTGTLRNSLTTTSGESTATGAEGYREVIAAAELGEDITGIYTAPYARIVHDGTSKRPPRPWVELAAMRWSTIVAAAVAKVRR